MSLTAPWTVKKADAVAVATLTAALGLSEVAAICLVNRGITSAQEAKAFLNPRLADLKTPAGLPDMETAAKRFAEEIKKGLPVGVFGDYDVDGISSAALLVLFLRKIGGRVEPIIADRFAGYGLSQAAVDGFIEKECQLVIVADCGTSDHQSATYAKERGLDLIVVDHHRVEGSHPDVFAFVNPQRKDGCFGDTPHAAVGIVFYFIAATRAALISDGWLRPDELDLRPFLDLVALGTVADVVPLTGNNRILVFHGLRQMTSAPREGIAHLIRASRIRSSEIRSEHISFQFAPRLNAAGRMSQAAQAFALLVSTDTAQIVTLVNRLEELSATRRILENEVLAVAQHQIEARGISKLPVLLVSGDGWHRGVIGIVAVRLAERYNRPAYVVGFDGHQGYGSVRGIGQLNLFDSLDACAPYLVRFGGHKDAAGFSLLREHLADFERTLLGFAQKNWMGETPQTIECDATLKPSDISPSLLHELSRLGPFGVKNEEPIFDIDGLYVIGKKVVGGDHLRLDLKTSTGTIGAFGPRMGYVFAEVPSLVRVAAHVNRDEWRRNGSAELRLAAPPVQGK